MPPWMYLDEGVRGKHLLSGAEFLQLLEKGVFSFERVALHWHEHTEEIHKVVLVLHFMLPWMTRPKHAYPTHLFNFGSANAGHLKDGQTKLLQQPENVRRW